MICFLPFEEFLDQPHADGSVVTDEALRWYDCGREEMQQANSSRRKPLVGFESAAPDQRVPYAISGQTLTKRKPLQFPVCID